MSRRIPVYVDGNSNSVGSILAPTDSPGPQWERVEIDGIEGTFERRYNQIRSIKVGSLDDAQRLPSFEAA